MKKLLLTMTCALYALSAQAAQFTDSIDINAEVLPSCFVVTAQDINFGLLTPGQSDFEAEGVLSWRCTRLALARIELDGGANTGDVYNRNMENADGAQLPYQLYMNAARNNVWGELGGGFFGLGDSRLAIGAGFRNVVDYTIYGKIEGVDVDNLDNGVYSDIITVTLNF